MNPRVLRSCGACTLLVLGTLLLPGLRPSAMAQPTLALLDSPRGDYIGAGALYYTTDPGGIAIRGDRNTFTVEAFGFQFWFDGPGDQPIGLGTYPNAARTPFNGDRPGLSIFGNGRGCNTVASSFEVLEWVEGPSGIERLWVTFRHSCEEVGPVATGELRIASTLAPSEPPPRTLRVPEDYLTLAAALAAARPLGDRIEVGPGQYAGPIDLGSKRVSVIAVEGPARTLLIGTAAAPAFTVAGGQDSSTVIEGFTIRDAAGGILVSGGSPVLRGNVISNCVYGINLQFSAAHVVSNTIVRCQGDPFSGLGNGSGIHLGGAESPRVISNTLDGNGNGITGWASGTPLIRDNRILRSTGDGITFAYQCDADIVQNLIAGNGGAGIAWLVPSGARGPYVLQNTIADNGGPGIAADGYDAGALVAGNIISGSPGIYCGDFNDLNPPVLGTNNVHSARGPAYGGNCPDPTGQSGNLSADPRFLAAERGDYRLLSDSPCLDRGAAVALTTTDLDGDPRLAESDGIAPARVDLGAFEFSPGPPRPPQTLVATGLEGRSLPDRVELTWLPFDLATGFVVGRAGAPDGPFTEIATVPTPRFEDTTAAAGVVHYYAVAGVNAYGTGAFSPALALRAGNRPPRVVDDLVFADEDTPVTLDPAANDPDPDGDALVLVVLDTPSDLVVRQTGTNLVLEPGLNWHGTNSFLYRVSDPWSGVSTGRVTVVVRPVNDPPVTAGGFYRIPGGLVYTLEVPVTDPENDPLTLEIVSPPDAGVAWGVPGQSRLAYQPAHRFIGRDAVAIRFFDGRDRSATAVLTIDVTAPVDLDRDGMADVWENQWDLNNPAADPDADGMANLGEYLALTSPRDPTSVLHLTSIQVGPEGLVRLRWASVGGVRYRVQSSDGIGAFQDLPRSAVEEIDPAPLGTPSEMVFIDTRPPASAGIRLYRVTPVAR